MIDLTDTPLVEPDWLAAHLSDPDLRLVDLRWRADGRGAQRYRAGHIPGAVHLDWERDLACTKDGVRYMLSPPDQFAVLMSAAGIGDETRVVAYAEADHSGATRLWWALRYYGHEQVAVLNGGLTRWLAEQRPLSANLPRPTPAHFTPRPQPNWLVTAADIEERLSDPRAGICLMDTRPPEQYAGHAVWTPQGSRYLPPNQDWVDVQGRRIRGGRLPGAISRHASLNLNPDDDWRYLRPQILRQHAQAANLNPDQQVVAYCGSGNSATVGLFALYLAGYRKLALYDASWEEWGADPNRPIERDE